MRILSWNVNGIRNPFAYAPFNSMSRSYKLLLDHLDADIICFQETKIQMKDLTIDMVAVEGYDAFFSLPRQKKGYSGVAVYVRRERCVPVKAEEGVTGRLGMIWDKERMYMDSTNAIGGYPPDSSYTIPPSTLDAEGRAVVLDFNLFVFIGLYCPANSGATDEGREFRRAYLKAVEDRVRCLREEGREVVVVGDLNVCRSALDTAEGAKLGKEEEWVNDFGRLWMTRLVGPPPSLDDNEEVEEAPRLLEDLCRKFNPEREGMFTCWNTRLNSRPNNYGARIDYVLTSPRLAHWSSHADIRPDIMGSDHCPVHADFKHELAPESNEEEQKQRWLLDLVNPQGTFVQNVRVVPPPPPPQLCAKHIGDFKGRQSLKDLFAKRPPSDGSGDASPVAAAESVPSHATLQTAAPLKRAAFNAVSFNGGETKKKTKILKTTKDASPAQKSLRGFFTAKAPAPAPAVRQSDPPMKEDKNTEATVVVTEPPTNLGCVDVCEPSKTLAEGKPSGTITEADYAIIQPETTRSSWSTLFTKPTAPLCTIHNEPCTELTSKKPGPNMGRRFWLCSRPVGPGYDNGVRPKGEVNREWRCNFFKWSSEAGRK